MSSNKCQKCGLVSFGSAGVCQRCGAPLSDQVTTDHVGSEPIYSSPSAIPTLLTSRPGALLLTLLFITIGIYNWYSLINSRYYYPKLAFLAPLGVLLFTLLTIFPGFVNRPRDTTYKIQIWVVMIVGLSLGALNFYLMGWVF